MRSVLQRNITEDFRTSNLAVSKNVNLFDIIIQNSMFYQFNNNITLIF